MNLSKVAEMGLSEKINFWVRERERGGGRERERERERNRDRERERQTETEIDDLKGFYKSC